MITKLYTDSDAFDVLSSQWNTLLSPTRTNSFFLHLEWQRTWWKHLQRGELAIVAIYADDETTLLGLAPLFIETENGQKVAHIIGCADVTDYLEILIAESYEEVVFNELLSFLQSPDMPEWDEISLCNIPEDSPTYTLLPDVAKKSGFSVNIEQAEVCPTVTLTGTYEDYLLSLDKKQRHELRRKRRKAEASGVGWYTVGSEHDLDEEISAFLDLMAMSTPDKAEFLGQPGHREFFYDIGHAFAEKGMFELIFLTVEDDRAAAMWQFIYKDRILLYNSGLNPQGFRAVSPGIVLLTYSIESATQRGITHYDFLRGDEVYKYRMGASDSTIYNVVLKRS